MVEIESLVFQILPDILGLGLVSYLAFAIFRARSSFFAAVRNWMITLFAVSLVFLWVSEIVLASFEGLHTEVTIAVDMTFIVFVMWTLVCLVSMTTIYRKQSSVDEFLPWFNKNPLNLVTAWGIVGLLILVPSWYLLGTGQLDIADDDWFFYVLLVYLLASVAVVAQLTMRTMRRGIGPRLPRDSMMAMYRLGAIWILIPTVVFAFDMILRLKYDVDGNNPHSWIVLILFEGMIGAFRDTRFTAVIVDPEVETVRREGFREYDIPRGIYLIEDDKPESAFNLFMELVTMPLRPDAKIPAPEESTSATLQYLIPRGFMIAREYPENLREKYRLQVTPIMWLSESPGELRVAPTSLAVLADTAVRFMETTPNSIVLLEGIEYLITFNEFKKVLKTLDTLNETAWINKTRLILAVNPKAFDIKELAMLERDRKVVKAMPGIDHLKRESRIEAVKPAETPPK